MKYLKLFEEFTDDYGNSLVIDKSDGITTPHDIIENAYEMFFTVVEGMDNLDFILKTKENTEVFSFCDGFGNYFR
jgi:hypothetical protein